MTITDEQLAAWEKLCEAEAEWWGDEAECPNCRAALYARDDEVPRGLCGACLGQLTSAMPALLAEVRRLRTTLNAAEVLRLETERDAARAECEAMRAVVEAACELYDNWCDTSAEDISSLRLDTAIDAYRAARSGR